MMWLVTEGDISNMQILEDMSIDEYYSAIITFIEIQEKREKAQEEASRRKK